LFNGERMTATDDVPGIGNEFEHIDDLPIYVVKKYGWRKLCEAVYSVISRFPEKYLATLKYFTVYVTLKKAGEEEPMEEDTYLLMEYEEDEVFDESEFEKSYGEEASFYIDMKKKVFTLRIPYSYLRSRRNIRERIIAEGLLYAYDTAETLTEEDQGFFVLKYETGLSRKAVLEHLIKLGFWIWDSEIEELAEEALYGKNEFNEEEIIKTLGFIGTRYEKQARRVIRRLKERYRREAKRFMDRIRKRMRAGKTMQEAIQEELEEERRKENEEDDIYFYS